MANLDTHETRVAEFLADVYDREAALMPTIPTSLSPIRKARPCAVEHSWPGNIRELRNVVERLLLLADNEVSAEDVRQALPASRTHAVAEMSQHEASTTSNGPLAVRVQSFERAQVLAELELHNRHITQTAKALGLERSHLYKKCQQLGIDLQTLKPEEE